MDGSSSYTVTVSNISGNSALGLNMNDSNGSIQDSDGGHPASFTGEIYTTRFSQPPVLNLLCANDITIWTLFRAIWPSGLIPEREPNDRVFRLSWPCCEA